MSRLSRRWVLIGGVLVGFFGGLAACENTVQRQRSALCRRAVPAIAEAETPLRLLRVGTGSASGTIRVDYLAGRRQHWAICHFGVGSELVGVTTDRANLSGPSLYMLKRFYLDTPDAAKADPAGG